MEEKQLLDGCVPAAGYVEQQSTSRACSRHQCLQQKQRIGQWRSQKFSTRGTLISGFPSYPHNPLLIYLIHYVTKYFSEKYTDYAQDSFRRLVLESLDKLQTYRWVLRVNPHTYIHVILRNHIPKILCSLLTGCAYAPDATCIATPLE